MFVSLPASSRRWREGVMILEFAVMKWFLELSPPQGEPLIIPFWELPRGDASRKHAFI